MTDATALDPSLAAHIAEHIARAEIVEHVDTAEPLPDDRFLDRELSWLAFNQRVLELAEDGDIPLLERVRFLAIFASNLDEFFMVRVAGLKRRIATGIAVTAASGLSPRQVLEAISEEAHRLMARHAAVFAEQVQPALAHEGITLVRWDELGESEQDRLRKFFRRQIFPVLTPLAVDPAHPFPYISGLSLNLAVVVTNPGDRQGALRPGQGAAAAAPVHRGRRVGPAERPGRAGRVAGEGPDVVRARRGRHLRAPGARCSPGWSSRSTTRSG